MAETCFEDFASRTRQLRPALLGARREAEWDLAGSAADLTASVLITSSAPGADRVRKEQRGEVAAPSWMEQSVDVGAVLSLLVRCEHVDDAIEIAASV